MTAGNPELSRRLKVAGLLVALGLAVEALTMAWSHPTAFLAFLFAGGTLVAVGVLLYLYAIVTYTATPPREDVAPLPD